MENELEDFKRVLDEVLELKKRKMQDYGNSWKIFGINGIYYQLGSKFIRLWNLREKDPTNEPLRDTLRDMLVYCAMGIQLLDSNCTEDSIDKLLKCMD